MRTDCKRIAWIAAAILSHVGSPVLADPVDVPRKLAIELLSFKDECGFKVGVASAMPDPSCAVAPPIITGSDIIGRKFAPGPRGTDEFLVLSPDAASRNYE